MNSGTNTPGDFPSGEVVIDETVDVEIARRDVEETRASIGETLEALKDKLNPTEVMEQAKQTANDVVTSISIKAQETVHAVAEDVTEHAKEVASHAREGAKDAASGAVSGAIQPIKEAASHAVESVQETGATIGARIQSNPLPLLLLGATALFFYGRKNGSGTPARGASQTPPEGGGIVEKAKDVVSSTAETAGHAISSGVDSTKHAVGSGIDAAKNAVSTGYDVTKGAAKATVRGAKNTGSSLLHTVEANPLPALLIGAGTAMLLASGKKNDHSSETYESDRLYYGDMSPEGTDERTALDRAKQKANQAKDRVTDLASGAKDKTAQAVHTGRDTLSETFQSNPLLVGAVAVGIGAAASMLIPPTDWERQMVGDASDRAKEKATEAISEVSHEAKEIAQQGLQTAADEAKSRGLVV